MSVTDEQLKAALDDPAELRRQIDAILIAELRKRQAAEDAEQERKALFGDPEALNVSGILNPKR